MRDVETYLTPAEIERISRRKYAKAQAKRLAKLGWTFELDGDGWPLILRAYHDEKLGLKPEKRRRPRLAGLAAA